MSNEDDLKWHTTYNGRLPQNMKSRISQQPLVGSYSNLKLKITGLNQGYKKELKKTTIFEIGNQPHYFKNER